MQLQDITFRNKSIIENLYCERPLLIASMHSKERVIGPVMEKALGVKPSKCEGFDTDQFGTFTGEISRHSSSLITARKKCLEAMHTLGFDLAIASEGSFGPHPQIPFISANEEILYFIDLKHQIELYVHHIDCETNFKQAEISDFDTLQRFAIDIGFPEHGVIFRKDLFSKNTIYKDCMDWRDLKIQFNNYSQLYKTFYIETDMRAMRNPTRMKVIERAAEKLVEKITSLCPSCSHPGFDIHNVERGLPCMQCQLPTKTIKQFIYKCPSCGFQLNQAQTEKQYEDPMYCDICNP
jgi:hypothetical protein